MWKFLKTFINILFYSLIFCFLLYSCHSFRKIDSVSSLAISIDSLIIPDSITLKVISPFRDSIETEMNRVLAYSEIAITKNQPEGLLNNFVADLLLEMCNKYYTENNIRYDVVLLNYGGLRAALPKGLITVGDIYRLMPFENEVVVITLTPDKFLEMVQYIIESGGQPFAGMQIVTRKLQITELLVNSKPFTNDRNYTVITSDYLASGSENTAFFLNPVDYKSLGIKVRDLIIEYLKLQTQQNLTIRPTLDRRIKYE